MLLKLAKQGYDIDTYHLFFGERGIENPLLAYEYVQKKALLAKELQSTLDERLQSEVRNWEQAVKYTKSNKLEEAAKEAKAELKKVKEQIKTQEDLKRELGLG